MSFASGRSGLHAGSPRHGLCGRHRLLGSKLGGGSKLGSQRVPAVLGVFLLQEVTAPKKPALSIEEQVAEAEAAYKKEEAASAVGCCTPAMCCVAQCSPWVVDAV